MQINLQHDLDRLASQLHGSAKQARFAVAKGLTRTAAAVKEAELAELKRALDRPTPYTLGGLYVQKATRETLEARVGFKDQGAGASRPVIKYLQPNIDGRARRLKGFEVALVALGAMPAGMRCVPTRQAQRDASGNPSRMLLKRILADLRAAGVVGPLSRRQRTRLANRDLRQGGRYFAIPRAQKGLPAGIYHREYFVRGTTTIFLFKASVSYRQRFDFWGVGRATVERELSGAMAKAMAETMSTAQTTVRGESQ